MNAFDHSLYHFVVVETKPTRTHARTIDDDDETSESAGWTNENHAPCNDIHPASGVLTTTAYSFNQSFQRTNDLVNMCLRYRRSVQ